MVTIYRFDEKVCLIVVITLTYAPYKLSSIKHNKHSPSQRYIFQLSSARVARQQQYQQPVPPPSLPLQSGQTKKTILNILLVKSHMCTYTSHTHTQRIFFIRPSHTKYITINVCARAYICVSVYVYVYACVYLSVWGICVCVCLCGNMYDCLCMRAC